MAEIPSTETVGNVFAEQYYTILRFKPEESYKFYENSSVATWDAKDVVTTLEGIREMIMSSNFKDCLVEIEDIHSQDSLQGSVLVVVTGCTTGKDDSKRKFSQTFFLAKHKTGFFVMNDILRFVDDKVPKSPSVGDSEPVQVSDDVCIQVESSAADRKNVSDSIDVKVKDEIVAETQPDVKVKDKVVAETQPKQIVSEIVPNVKDAAPKSSYLEMLSKEKTSSTPAPATRFVRVSAFDGLLEQEKAKLLAVRNGLRKPTALTSPANNVIKDETPPTLNKSASAENINAPKGIYVGGLLPNTTINDLTEAVKTFGRVKKFDGVQVVLYEDQYCFGFVHFQSADSAKKAVEAQVITVNGKEAYISYKRSGRKTRDGNDNRGRGSSTSVRGKSHSRSPSRNGHSSNGDTRRSVANQHDNNNGNRSSDGHGGEADGWRSVQRGRNGYAHKRNDQKMQNGQRRGNGEAVQDQGSSTDAVASSQQ